jgi:hypothetical protein
LIATYLDFSILKLRTSIKVLAFSSRKVPYTLIYMHIIFRINESLKLGDCKR